VTSSGLYTFNASNGELVLAAYERVQIRAPELRQEHMATGWRELNFLFAKISNLQPNLWKIVLNQISLVQGTGTYSIPNNVVMILDSYRALNTGTSSETDIYTTPISRTEYATYASKYTQGPPIVFWFNRTPPAQTVTFYPVPDGNGPYTWFYYACLQMQNANLPSGETPDVPYLWLDALVAGLAHRLARVYAPPLEAQRKADADEAWAVAAAQNTENVPFTLAPGIGTFYRRW
jgi:hypothetical protein